jgi:hypothetical protein
MTDPVVVVLGVARLGVAVLGLAVAARGVRGYRRTGSHPLLAFGVAFTLISVNPLVALVVGTFFGARTVGYASVASDVVLYGAAFSLVLYALYRLT